MNAAAEPLLAATGLSKLFGALVAVDGVTIDFAPGKVHAIIGPNGAGKTTLINLLCGDLSPSQGTIAFKDRDITKLTPFQTSRAGIGRSYQKSNIFPEFSCLENCWLGAQSRLPTSMRFFRPADRYAEVRARAERALDLCGLGRRRDVGAAQISHGEQRQLEIAMMLATEPELLLLDEPLAGMGTAFSSSLFGLAGSLVLGFLELQAGQAHNRFLNELEEWLSGITDLSPETAVSSEQVNRQLSSAILHMQRAIEDLSNRLSDQSIASSMGQGGASSGDEKPFRELARGVNQLVSQMRAEQKVVREWVDEQAAQQSDVASALRELAVNIKRRS